MRGAAEPKTSPVETVIVPRARDLGGFEVRRALPSARRQMVGPFIFFDQMGPAEFLLGAGHRRAPAPAHRARDRDLPARRRDHPPRQPRHAAADPPGRGQLDDRGPRHRPFRAHGAEARAAGAPSCSASRPGSPCPSRTRRPQPAFAHHGTADLPLIEDGGTTVRLILGRLYGRTSPVRTFSEMFYADASARGRRPAAARRRATRSARSTSSPARSRSPATASTRRSCWCSARATRSRSPRARRRG